MLAGKRRVFLPLPMGEGWGEGLPLEALLTSRPCLCRRKPWAHETRLSPSPFAKVRRSCSLSSGERAGVTGLLEGEGWGEGGSPPTAHARTSPTAVSRQLFLPLPVGEGWGEGSSAQPPPPQEAAFSPLSPWERVFRSKRPPHQSDHQPIRPFGSGLVVRALKVPTRPARLSNQPHIGNPHAAVHRLAHVVHRQRRH